MIKTTERLFERMIQGLMPQVILHRTKPTIGEYYREGRLVAYFVFKGLPDNWEYYIDN